jgi:hypothetical protein
MHIYIRQQYQFVLGFIFIHFLRIRYVRQIAAMLEDVREAVHLCASACTHPLKFHLRNMSAMYLLSCLIDTILGIECEVYDILLYAYAVL